MITEALLKVRKEGQGKEGFKRVLPFPKIVFLYTDELHGKGKEYEWLFDRAIECSSKRLTPDYISEKIMKKLKINGNGDGDCYSCMGLYLLAHVKPLEPRSRVS